MCLTQSSYYSLRLRLIRWTKKAIVRDNIPLLLLFFVAMYHSPSLWRAIIQAIITDELAARCS